jgi:hypothetical protein
VNKATFVYTFFVEKVLAIGSSMQPYVQTLNNRTRLVPVTCIAPRNAWFAARQSKYDWSKLNPYEAFGEDPASLEIPTWWKVPGKADFAPYQ